MVLSAEVAVRKCSIKKVPLRIPENSLEDTSVKGSFKKETPTEVLPCEFFKKI